MHGTSRLDLIRGLALGCALVGTGLLMAGCIVHHHHDAPGPVVAPPGHARRGPPAHAPAHGYRRKHPHDGVELVYDSQVGVYVVAGYTAVYWDGDRYLRWSDAGWTVSARIDGGWVSVGVDAVPSGLRARHTHTSSKGKKGRGPAKHAY